MHIKDIQKCKFVWNDLLLNRTQSEEVEKCCCGVGVRRSTPRGWTPEMKKMATVGSIGLAALEALPVDDGWARFVILLFGNPHLLES
jgi:hypothetical protein